MGHRQTVLFVTWRAGERERWSFENSLLFLLLLLRALWN